MTTTQFHIIKDYKDTTPKLQVRSLGTSYSSDLSPCDFHVFVPMKNELAKKWYHIDEKVKQANSNCCFQTGQKYFEPGISKLVQRYEKYRNLLDDYVEK